MRMQRPLVSTMDTCGPGSATKGSIMLTRCPSTTLIPEGARPYRRKADIRNVALTMTKKGSVAKQ